MILNNKVVNSYGDAYEPVRFMHSKHANVLGDCTICHHRTPREAGDKYGRPTTMAELKSGAAEPVACSTCHDHPFRKDQLQTPGLKGAYHQMCIDCHQEAEQTPHARGPVIYSSMVRGPEVRPLETRAPTDCLSCHSTRVPDHNKLVKLSGPVDPKQVTENCLSCHEKEGQAIMKTSHWNWQGPSPFTVGHEKRVDLGKRRNTINNFCINLNGNWPRCTSCHIGYGWKDKNFDFNDPTNIDCLVCHDSTGTYTKSPAGAGAPAKGVDLIKVAKNVGRPSRNTCGMNCHFVGGGGDAVKHGDMSSAMAKPTRSHDVHMSVGEDGMNFRCQDCHKTRNHMIAGRSISVPATEGDLSCEQCHTDSPHIGAPLVDKHLNRHTKHLACQTCHIPIYSKATPTKVHWDWSQAGRNRKPVKDEYGMPDYNKKKGAFKWRAKAKPTYRWYNGTVKRSLLGDRIDPDGTTELSAPVGQITDPAAKIYPFKVHRGRQPADPVNKQLIAPRLWGGYWKHWDWNKAAEEGMKQAGLPYSGKMDFVDTVMYWGLTHEVAPKDQALSCAACHPGLARGDSCGQCHQPRSDVDYKARATKGFHSAEGTEGSYLPFTELGYPGDPIEKGGRFRRLGQARPAK